MGDRPVEARESSAEAPAEAASEAGESGPAEPAGDAPAEEAQLGADQAGGTPAAAETDDSIPETADAVSSAGAADTADLPAEELQVPGESGEAEPAGQAGENEPAAEAGESEPDPDMPLDDLQAEPAREDEADPQEPAPEFGFEDDDGGEAPPAEGADAVPEEEVDDTELGSRPSVADAHPDDYTAADHEPPAVDQPHESPEGWARDINHDETEPGRDNNCGECARAVQSTWEGDPAAAAALSDPDANGENISRMVDWAGGQPELASMSEINQRLDELGPGSSAIIGCTWPDGRGHWFNAVNDGGSVKAVDGQSGSVEPWPPSDDGLGFNESHMDKSFAIFFDRDGKVAN